MFCGDGTAPDPSEKRIFLLLEKIFYETSLPGPVRETCKCEGLETSSNAHIVTQDRICSHHIKVPPEWCHHIVMIKTIKKWRNQFPPL